MRKDIALLVHEVEILALNVERNSFGEEIRQFMVHSPK